MKQVKKSGCGGMEKRCDTLHCFYHLRVRFQAPTFGEVHHFSFLLSHFEATAASDWIFQFVAGDKQSGARDLCVFRRKNATDLVQMKTIEVIGVFAVKFNNILLFFV